MKTSLYTLDTQNICFTSLLGALIISLRNCTNKLVYHYLDQFIETNCPK